MACIASVVLKILSLNSGDSDCMQGAYTCNCLDTSKIFISVSLHARIKTKHSIQKPIYSRIKYQLLIKSNKL